MQNLDTKNIAIPKQNELGTDKVFASNVRRISAMKFGEDWTLSLKWRAVMSEI